MSLAKLRASLTLWRTRLAYRKQRHNFYHRESKRPTTDRTKLARKWHLLVQEAEGKVARRQKQIVSMTRKNVRAAAKTSGVARYDGVPVAAWLVPYLEWARRNGWHGKLVSGWRDPAYSESLCMRMCGRPSCPGRCAGRNSNHAGSVRPRGALDVSDYQTFDRLMRTCPLQPRIFNALGARDPVHFSASGN